MVSICLSTSSLISGTQVAVWSFLFRNSAASLAEGNHAITMLPHLFLLLLTTRLEKGLLISSDLRMITAIIAKTQEELQDMVNRLVDTGRKCGMEINTDKSQVMRVARRNDSLWIEVCIRELNKVNHFKYLGSVLIRDGYYTTENKT